MNEQTFKNDYEPSWAHKWQNPDPNLYIPDSAIIDPVYRELLRLPEFPLVLNPKQINVNTREFKIRHILSEMGSNLKTKLYGILNHGSPSITHDYRPPAR